ncbi:MAG TPA: hypothetical protein VIU62_17495 [Chloroflexota bacterium]
MNKLPIIPASSPVDPREDERQRFFADLTDQVAATRADPGAWNEEVAERAALEGTLLDGLFGPDHAATSDVYFRR